MFNAAQIARSKIQKAKGARVSIESAGVMKSARAKAAMAQITTAVIAIMTMESPSARSATPRGGIQPPIGYTSEAPAGRASAIASAIARPSGMTPNAMRST